MHDLSLYENDVEIRAGNILVEFLLGWFYVGFAIFGHVVAPVPSHVYRRWTD